MKNFFAEAMRFAGVGVVVTLTGMSLMLLFYNLLHLGYWASSGLSLFLASILSFGLNRSFTFRSQAAWHSTVWRFAINIAVCYGIAYSLARPLVNTLVGFTNLSVSVTLQENVALLGGNVVFTLLNFIGQRTLVFRKRQSSGI